jgi:hypothetical protein
MSYISDLNSTKMEYSAYADPSIMPLIHPSEDDIQMGAVDYLSADPLGLLPVTNSTVPENSTLHMAENSTLVAQVSDVFRVFVPRVFEHVGSLSSPLSANHTSIDGEHLEVTPEVPTSIQLDYVPLVPTQVYI